MGLIVFGSCFDGYIILGFLVFMEFVWFMLLGFSLVLKLLKVLVFLGFILGIVRDEEVFWVLFWVFFDVGFLLDSVDCICWIVVIRDFLKLNNDNGNVNKYFFVNCFR